MEGRGEPRNDEGRSDDGWSEKRCLSRREWTERDSGFWEISGKDVQQVYLEVPSCCSWTLKQDKPGAAKLRSFKYFFRRMNDLTERNDGIRGKVSEVERQLRDRVLEACCEEQMAKSSRQEARAMEEERARQQRVQQGHGEERVEEENREEMREIVDRTTATSRRRSLQGSGRKHSIGGTVRRRASGPAAMARRPRRGLRGG